MKLWRIFQNGRTDDAKVMTKTAEQARFKKKTFYIFGDQVSFTGAPLVLWKFKKEGGEGKLDCWALQVLESVCRSLSTYFKVFQNWANHSRLNIEHLTDLKYT